MDYFFCEFLGELPRRPFLGTGVKIALATAPKRGRGDQPRLKLYNATTLATIGTRRITQLQYFLHLSSPTS
jgi:hypothetical protein